MGIWRGGNKKLIGEWVTPFSPFCTTSREEPNLQVGEWRL